jgi:ankyrin repeat protein
MSSGRRNDEILIFHDLDLTNYSITNQLANFLEQFKSENQDVDELVEELIDDSKGHCHGLTSLILYSLFIQSQPLRLDVQGKVIARDDWTWVQKTIKNLTEWHASDDMDDEGDTPMGAHITILSEHDKLDIERLAQLIEFMQNTTQYSNTSEGDLDSIIEDTRNRALTADFAITGVFCSGDLTNKIGSESILNTLTLQNALVMVGSETHMVGFIALEDKIYFYDSQAQSGHTLQVIDINDLIELEKAILNSLHEQSNNQSDLTQYTTIDFRVFTTTPGNIYANKIKLLANTHAVKSNAIFTIKNILNQPAKIGDNESLIFYHNILKQNPLTYRLDEENDEGWSNIHLAAFNGRLETTAILLDLGADPNKRISEGSGNTPLYLATIRGHTNVMALLLESNAQVNFMNENGNTAIHGAVIANQLNAIDILYQAGADINSQNNNKKTPLHMAVIEGNLNAVNMLLRMGANPNLPDRHGFTALHIASKNKLADIVEVLIKFGANIGARTRDNRVPSQLTKNKQILTLLKNSHLAIPHSSINISHDPYFAGMTQLRNENLNKLNTFIQQDMNGQINPPIICIKTGMKELQAPSAIYIEAIHEIFQESETIDNNEKTKLLRNINKLLAQEVPYYIDILRSNVAKFLEDIKVILGDNSKLATKLKIQTNTHPSITLDKFKEHCKLKKINSIQVGGVYGRACVWDVARQLGKNIFAKNIGDKHANIRYADMDDDFQFENVFINVNITEGFSHQSTIIFDEYVKFPQISEPHLLVAVTAPGVVEEFEDEMKDTPQEIGQEYDHHFSEVNNPVNHQMLFNKIQQALLPADMTKDIDETDEEMITSISIMGVLSPYASEELVVGSSILAQMLSEKNLHTVPAAMPAQPAAMNQPTNSLNSDSVRQKRKMFFEDKSYHPSTSSQIAPMETDSIVNPKLILEEPLQKRKK